MALPRFLGCHQAAVRALRLTEELCAKLCFVGHERCDLNEVEGSFSRASGVIIWAELLLNRKTLHAKRGCFWTYFHVEETWNRINPPTLSRIKEKNGRKSIPLSVPNHKRRLRCLKLILGLVVVASWQIPRQIQQLPACGFASACFYRADAIAFRALSWEGTLEPHSGLARPDEFTGAPFRLWTTKTWSFQGPGSCLQECLMVSL